MVMPFQSHVIFPNRLQRGQILPVPTRLPEYSDQLHHRQSPHADNWELRKVPVAALSVCGISAAFAS